MPVMGSRVIVGQEGPTIQLLSIKRLCSKGQKPQPHMRKQTESI